MPTAASLRLSESVSCIPGLHKYKYILYKYNQNSKSTVTLEWGTYVAVCRPIAARMTSFTLEESWARIHPGVCGGFPWRVATPGNARQTWTEHRRGVSEEGVMIMGCNLGDGRFAARSGGPVLSGGTAAGGGRMGARGGANWTLGSMDGDQPGDSHPGASLTYIHTRTTSFIYKRQAIRRNI